MIPFWSLKHWGRMLLLIGICLYGVGLLKKRRDRERNAAIQSTHR